ncbi:hypothetical protein Fot_04722 [Forsythia ovata]|uniref:DUF761 domain-containing protein n=1 Tax=Forsythia ovata TaxID=205694 RepID=A0ABD1XGF1_9LAMI
MKNNSAALFLKHIISLLGSLAKSKSISFRNKTDAMKARFTVYSLLKNKKLSLGAIRHKIHEILGNNSHDHDEEDVLQDENKAIVLYNAKTNDQLPSTSGQIYLTDHDEYDDKYPDLRHSLFDEDDDMDLGDPNASAIDLVKNSKEDSENFNLEDEIDQVADLFILKFHKKIRLQKLESFKRYQEMLERST